MKYMQSIHAWLEMVKTVVWKTVCNSIGRVLTNSFHVRSDVRYRAGTDQWLEPLTAVVGGRRLDN